MTPSVDDARKQQDNAGDPEGPEKGLISEETQKAASASLSALLAATRKPEEPAANGEIDSSRTLEDVVRDALSPHLREWLDSNLPPIIEGEVRREVRRLVKQVEQSLD